MITIVRPIINITVTQNIIASNVLKVSAMLPNRFTILLSAIGCVIADSKEYVIVKIVNLIIGDKHNPSITIIPTNPTAFFNIPAHPITASVASPNIFPTTGITVETAAFVVLAVTPSTVWVKLPSNESTVTNKVIIIPKVQMVDEFKNLDNLEIFISSDICEIMFKLVEINIIGNIKFEIVFPIKFISNNNIGCTTLAEVIAPVVSIKVINIGNKLLLKPTRFWIVSLTKEIQLEKLVSIIVVINMNSTKYVTWETLLFSNESLIDDNMLCIIIIISTIPYSTYNWFEFSTKYI